MSYTNPFTETFDYEKHWTSAEDFPTFEAEETQVREDMQALYTEIAGALNTLTAALKAVTAAGYLGVTGAEDSNFENATNIQEALQALSDAIDSLVAQTVPANSITTAMIIDEQVTTAKLADGSVTAPKLADDAVTAPKIDDGAVGTAALAASAVTPAKADFTGAPLTIGAPKSGGDPAIQVYVSGPMILNAESYGNTEPTAMAQGQVFFKKA